jgi:hypothetical protein
VRLDALGLLFSGLAGQLAYLQYAQIFILVWHYTFALFSLNYAKIPILEEAKECRDGPEGAETPAH